MEFPIRILKTVKLVQYRIQVHYWTKIIAMRAPKTSAAGLDTPPPAAPLEIAFVAVAVGTDEELLKELVRVEVETVVEDFAVPLVALVTVPVALVLLVAVPELFTEVAVPELFTEVAELTPELAPELAAELAADDMAELAPLPPV
jgi:hypothetical protein